MQQKAKEHEIGYKMGDKEDKHKTDNRIIFTTLRKNSRITLTDLSRKTNIPISTLYEKLRTYTGDIIQRYTAILDFAKLGFPVRMHFFLKVQKNKKEMLISHIIHYDQVNNAYRINNGYDLFCEGVFQDINTAEQFISDLEDKYGVVKFQTFYLLEDLKREQFFTDLPVAT